MCLIIGIIVAIIVLLGLIGMVADILRGDY